MNPPGYSLLISLALGWICHLGGSEPSVVPSRLLWFLPVLVFCQVFRKVFRKPLDPLISPQRRTLAE